LWHRLGRLVPMLLVGVDAGRSGRHVSDHHGMLISRRFGVLERGCRVSCRVQR
jgi:hypothetical protein